MPGLTFDYDVPPAVDNTAFIAPQKALPKAASTPPKAPPVVGPLCKKATRPKTAIPQYLIDEARSTEPQAWDAERHLAFEPPAKITTMKEVGLEGHGISPTAVSSPFPLFTKEAMLQMRREIFSEPVLANCRYSSDFIANMVRGMGHEYVPSRNPRRLRRSKGPHTDILSRRAPFTYNAWLSEETLGRISEVAGVELVPAYDFEVANINISINDQNSQVLTNSDKTAAVAWHYDSFPFVCVTMASDCTDMVGGETAIKLPNGEITKARGPAMVRLSRSDQNPPPTSSQVPHVVDRY